MRGPEHRWRFAQGSLMVQRRCVPAKVDMRFNSSNEPYCLIDSHDKSQKSQVWAHYWQRDTFLIRQGWRWTVPEHAGCWNVGFYRTLRTYNTLLTLGVCCHVSDPQAIHFVNRACKLTLNKYATILWMQKTKEHRDSLVPEDVDSAFGTSGNWLPSFHFCWEMNLVSPI